MATPEATPTAPAPTATPAPTADPAPAPETGDTGTVTNEAPQVKVKKKRTSRRLMLRVAARDDRRVVKVGFYIGGRLRAIDRVAPFRATLNLPKHKAQQVTVRAYDAAGLVGTDAVRAGIARR